MTLTMAAEMESRGTGVQDRLSQPDGQVPWIHGAVQKAGGDMMSCEDSEPGGMNPTQAGFWWEKAVGWGASFSPTRTFFSALAH